MTKNKFKVVISKCYEIDVYAMNPEEAEEKAFEIPIEKWDDPFETEVVEIEFLEYGDAS
jgi:hypothetical protein